MDEFESIDFHIFDDTSDPLPPGTPATPRPADRPRDTSPPAEAQSSIDHVIFDVTSIPIPPGTPARLRPADRPRPMETAVGPADEAFARELADRVRDYVRDRPAGDGLREEQIAALVHHYVYVARRPA